MDSEQEVPDFFADGIGLQAGPFGFAISFHLSVPDKTKAGEVGRLVARARVSPRLAKELATLLANAVEIHDKAPERSAGPLPRVMPPPRTKR